MSSRRRELLMAALHRAGRPLNSGEVEDAARGLAQAEGWPEAHLEELTRKSVSGLLRHLVNHDKVMYAGEAVEEGRSGSVPTYRPTAAFDANYPIPDSPPASRIPAKESRYNELNKSQLIALLDVHDGLAECHARFMGDLERWRDRSRTRLAAAGLGES